MFKFASGFALGVAGGLVLFAYGITQMYKNNQWDTWVNSTEAGLMKMYPDVKPVTSTSLGRAKWTLYSSIY